MDEHDIFKTLPREPLFEVPTTFVEPDNFTHFWDKIYYYRIIPNNAINAIIIYVDERKDKQENE